MIKRMYSLSVRKPHVDGSGSYSFNHFTFNRISWFSHSEKCFDEAMEHMKDSMQDEAGDKLEVIHFCRI